MIGKQTIFLGLSIIIGSIFVILLLSVLELESYYFDMNEEVSFHLDAETKYMVLVDDMFQGVQYQVEQSNQTSHISYPFVPGYQIEYSLDASVDGTNYYLNPYGEYTSVTVNEYDGIGTIVLPAGDVIIRITPDTSQTTDMAESFQFAFIPSSLIVMIIFTVITGIGTLALFIVSLVMRAQAARASEMDPYGYHEDQHQFNPGRDQDLFDMSNDDIFSQYTENKKHNSSWDDE